MESKFQKMRREFVENLNQETPSTLKADEVIPNTQKKTVKSTKREVRKDGE